MELLQKRIREDGVVLPGNILKVDSFLNHQIDVSLLNKIGEEFARRFAGIPVTKILTIEASGIGVACITAQYFNVPVVFAKKVKSKNIGTDLFHCEVRSFTKDTVYPVTVSKMYLSAEDSVLIIDDFLAEGSALDALIRLVREADARVAGAGIVIEKGFQKGGDRIRSQGVRLESLAVIDRMSPEEGIVFRDDA
ncbi:xanthine phosphoribosyltransferase [Brucepastera parasyntrophica]|uniref:xanthine phosphoribosyltransferase n=1 Tax=Brucepastera parasyntrophica TaxID=2880008 RepID=UPI00210CC8E7|nr:xanthine phosphoribosyltransferase [Brucepastera parasyntrophica]ULQ60922.1 xanthine phosphoribosyltransferase [Brucepastera parasyntrophica]